MLELFRRALSLLPEKKIIEDDFSGPLLFVGDLHGDPTGVYLAEEFLHATDGKVVFLGDYADRGKHQRQTLQNLFSLFVRHPRRVILLRGNHEQGPAGHPLYVGPVNPYDVAFHLDPDELDAYEAVHVRLPLIYYNQRVSVLALHGFISASLLRAIPEVELSSQDERLIVWSDTDPLSTEFRGIRVPDPWDWSLERVEEVLKEKGLILLKGHSPHELTLKSERVRVLFAHCKDTGGYYDFGVRYALYKDKFHFVEEVPCGSHTNAQTRLRRIFR